MWSTRTLPLSEVKARLSEVGEEVATTHERVRITKNGREYVVLVAAEDLESIEATLELLSDPDAQDRWRFGAGAFASPSADGGIEELRGLRPTRRSSSARRASSSPMHRACSATTWRSAAFSSSSSS